MAKMTVNEKEEREGLERQLRMLSTISRMALAGGLGKTFEGNRDIYKEAGYKTAITYDDYRNRFDRQDVASRIVSAKPDATWRDVPDIMEDDSDNETTFELAWKDLVRDRRLFHYFGRVDTLAGIGRYGVLLLGVKGGKLEQPLVKAEGNKLMYLQPYGEGKATVATTVGDEEDERFGLPETYTIKMISGGLDEGKEDEKTVHWTRVIHVADDCLESEVYGTPRLQGVFNDLKELEQTIAAASEGFWMAAKPEVIWSKDKDADIDMTNAELNTEIQNLMMGLTRSAKLEGITGDVLDRTVESPKDMVEIIFQLFSSHTGIPTRLLTGSERGELASSQDRENWSDRIKERRRDFATPVILLPFIQRGIDYGFLPEASMETVTAEWPDIVTLTDKEKADNAKIITEAMAKYAATPGIEHVLPLGHYRTRVLGYTQEESDAIDEEVEAMIVEEEAEAAAVEEELAAERERAIAAGEMNPDGSPVKQPAAPPVPAVA